MKRTLSVFLAPPLFAIATVATAQGTATEADIIQRGAYLARVGDCVACHTAPGGKPFAGGLALQSPIGTIYSTNITPDKKTGIGTYTLEDFDKAVRRGISKEGHTLYPAMPYTSYAYVKPDDVKAIYTYFMRSVAPVEQQNKASDIPWPMSMRWPLAAWRKMFAPEAVPNDPTPLDMSTVARGRYLVTGLGHCSTCHTPRGVALNEKATTDAGAEFLSGAELEGWLARNLRGDHRDGLGSWTDAEIVALLKTGRNTHGATFGSMGDVVTHSSQHMTDGDLQAIAVYLKTLPAKRKKDAPLAYEASAAKALFNGTDRSIGAMTFINNCAACHRTDGKGYSEVFPPLALNPTVNADDPTSVIHIILKGARMPYTKTAPTEFTMPGFADRLSDSEVAAVATMVRQSWGNRAPAVTASDVAKVRKHATVPAGPAR